MILGIDTSGQNLGLALVQDGQVKGSYLSRPGLKHGEILQNTIRQFLDNNHADFKSLAGIAVTLGPGSFTGLRIGLAAAKGYAYALNLPLAGISSLSAISCSYSNLNKEVVTLIDAKRSELYWAVFDSRGDEPIRLLPDAVGPVDNLDELAKGPVAFCGPEHIRPMFQDKYPGCDYRFTDELNLAIPAAIFGERDISHNNQLDTKEAVPVYLRSQIWK
jgi:tRNA threonylcarbamoyladenosine biosynthesis protein TsaB